ncbi:MAG: hypothetical protein NC181_01370 [Clostridium sp.]|nr:hypothetical protein [Clostridium sp.]MCM1443972.1 hypothetical protein [Candidatus Amulumruptor caecigallinarius]
MEENLIKITKCLSGNVLLIGVNEPIIYDLVNDNEKILICNSLTNYKSGKSKKMYHDSTETTKSKLIKIKSLKKFFKKKRVDFIICNIFEIKKFFKSFLSSSIYINKDMIYLYGNTNNIDLEDLIKKYKRYTNDIRVEKFGNDFILYIDNKNSKTNVIKDFFYYIFDTFSNVRNAIADIMIG